MTTPVQGRSPPPADGQAGFTLLELLVSLALLVLLAGLIAGGLAFGRRVWQVTGELDHLSSVSAVRQVLADRLGEALPLAEPATGGAPRLAFSGETARLSFVTAMPGRRGPAGLYRTVLLWRRGAGGRGELVLEQTVFLPGVGSEGVGAQVMSVERHRLLRGVTGLAIRYLGSPKPGQPAVWQSTWAATDRLPRLVGISLAFAPGEPGTWPELIVPLRLAPGG